MIMVPFMGYVVELGLTAEVLFLGEAGLAQEFERAIHRGQADMGIFLGQQPIHLLGRHVFHFQKGREDVLTLAGQFQTVFRKMLLENLKLFGGFRHNNEFLHVWETHLTGIWSKGQAGIVARLRNNDSLFVLTGLLVAR